MLNPQSSERSGGASAVPQHIARYEILRELGRGGMAVVYLAHDPAVKRQVAIKVLPRQFTFDPQFRDRFHREAEAIAGLEHPAITPIYDYGEVDEQPYIVMRYMTGGSLADRMARGHISLSGISKVFNRLAGALDAAHQRGMVHRDIKPSNILFDPWDEAYLSDFGIVKLAESSATRFATGSMVLGTPAYMSPEQANGKGVDGRSDIYSLAVVLFELLTHQLPYKADTPMGLALAHIVQPVPDIQAVDPGLPPASNIIIRKALAKDPNDRYPTAGEIAAAVAQLANGAWMGPPVETAWAPPERYPSQMSHAAPESVLFRRSAIGDRQGGRGLSLPARLGLSIGSGLAAFVVGTGLCLGIALAANNLWLAPTPTPAQAQVAVSSNTPTATSTAADTATPTPSGTATDTPTNLPSATATGTNTRQPPTTIPTATPLPTNTPQPQCNPPEFFDPFMNRCRMPDSPQASQPGDGGGSPSGGGSTPPPSSGGGGGCPDCPIVWEPPVCPPNCIIIGTVIP